MGRLRGSNKVFFGLQIRKITFTLSSLFRFVRPLSPYSSSDIFKKALAEYELKEKTMTLFVSR